MSPHREMSHGFTRILALLALVLLMFQGMRVSELRKRLDRLDPPKVEVPAPAPGVSP